MQFNTPQDAESAYEKKGQRMGQRYIEIFPSSMTDWQRATGKHRPFSLHAFRFDSFFLVAIPHS